MLAHAASDSFRFPSSNSYEVVDPPSGAGLLALLPYFSLHDRSKILPIVQPEEEEEAEDDENGGEDEEGEEEGSDEEEGGEEADEETEHDSSGDELPRKKSRKM